MHYRGLIHGRPEIMQAMFQAVGHAKVARPGFELFLYAVR
jgi:hypothetical protein